MEITATDFLKRAKETAEHFGFKPSSYYKKHPDCRNCESKLSHSASANDRKMDSLHGLLTSGINTYVEEKINALSGPVFYYNLEQVPRSGEPAITLHIHNVEKSVAEALLIHTTKALSSELGLNNHSVRINSLGDKDSIVRYQRELTNFLKKRIEDMPESARELMKDNVITALMHLIDKDHHLSHRSPNPMEYLSDQSRKHFRDLVEFLEISETAYEIDPKLIGHHHCYNDAMFAIDLLDEDGQKLPQEPLFIRGGRYSSFMERYTNVRGRSLHATGAVVVLRSKKAPLKEPKITKKPDPAIYLVQLGFGPKVRSMLLLEELRKAGIMAYQNIASDSISEQLREAEERKVKYTIIIGQKEYVDRTVILRDMIGRNQEAVAIDNLLTRLKKAKV